MNKNTLIMLSGALVLTGCTFFQRSEPKPCACGAVTSCACKAQPPAGPKPKVESAYPVMCWTYRGFEKIEDWDYLIDNWVRLGINRPLTPVVDGKTDKAKFRAFLDKCHAAGLKVYVYDERIGPRGAIKFAKKGDEAAYRAACRAVKQDWGNHPAVVGHYVYDEPDAPEAPGIFKAARIQREIMPDKEPFLNLLPWYTHCEKRFGANSLEEYLAWCHKDSGLSFFGYDCYTQQLRKDYAYEGYFKNLRIWGEFAKRTGIRWNTTLLCTQHFAYRIAGIDDFRWQISSAAAMGASGLCWFYPDHTGDYHGNYRDAPINPLGERTQTFAWMGEEMRIFQHRYGKEFATLKFDKAMMKGKTFGGVAPFARDELLLDVRTDDKKDDKPLLVSFFHDAKGARYAAIVNLTHNPEESRWIRMAFSDKAKPFHKMWDGWKRLTPSKDAGLANLLKEKGPVNSLGLYFAPGQLALIKLN